jgi:hypothetical protein
MWRSGNPDNQEIIINRDLLEYPHDWQPSAKAKISFSALLLQAVFFLIPELVALPCKVVRRSADPSDLRTCHPEACRS